MSLENTLAILTLLVLKPLLIITIVAFGFIFLHKKSAALQHFWLATGMIALLLLPALFGLLPEMEWQVLPALENTSANTFFAFIYSLVAWINKPQWLMLCAAIYFLVAFWLLFYLLLGCLALALQTRRASPCDDHEFKQLLMELSSELGIARKVKLVLSDAVQSPQMWGVLEPVIMLPANARNWSNERKLSVLLHEFGACGSLRLGDNAGGKDLLCAVRFLPPIWWLATRLFHCAEIACDDYIYRLHSQYRLRNPAATYAENLLAMAQAPNGKLLSTSEPVLPMAGHSPIFYRIEAILDRQRPRLNATPEARQYWVLALLVMLLPAASLQLIPIREILKAQVLNIHFPQQAQDSGSATLIGNDLVPVHRLDAETLRKLKQQLVSSESVKFPMEKIIVTGTQDLAGSHKIHDESSLVPEFGYPAPVIRIEGYMPLESAIPEYPRAALQQGIEGEVIVEFAIAQDGSIIDPRILRSQPRHKFDKAVLSALQRSRYKPQIIDGQPVILQGVIETFTFRIAHSPRADTRRR